MRSIVLGMALLTATGMSAFADERSGYADDHVLVKLSGLPSGLSKQSLQVVETRDLAAALGFPEGTKLVENGFARWDRQTHFKAGGLNGDWLLRRWMYLELPAGMTPESCLRQLKGNPWIEYAERDPIGCGGNTYPTDPVFTWQWHLYNPTSTNRVRADIHAPEAWDIATGTNSIIVAVLDTGLDMTLDEFSGRWVQGYDIVNNDSNPTDDNGHGTAVAGTLAANANNGQFGAGLDWACNIMPVKVLNSVNYGEYSWWAAGIDWAVSNGCKVINLSAGGTLFTDTITLSNAIERAITNGVVFVTITHNYGNSVITFPGSLSNVITVGATMPNDTRATFSNYGPALDLVAPGSNIVTVGRFGSLMTWWGTSFSAPLVSGAAALLLSRDPSLSHYQVRNLLCAGADDRVGDAQDTAGFDMYYGWGRLNIQNSLALLETRLTARLETNGNLVCSWACPTNAAMNHPYRVEYADSPTGVWQEVSSEITYDQLTATIGTNMDSSAGFYRIAVPHPE